MARPFRTRPGRPGIGEAGGPTVKKTAKIPLDLAQAAEAFRKVKRWSFQRLVREALTDYLRRQEHQPEPSDSEPQGLRREPVCPGAPGLRGSRHRVENLRRAPLWLPVAFFAPQFRGAKIHQDLKAGFGVVLVRQFW